MFDWNRAIANTNVNEKVFVFDKTILNMLPIFIPHETLTTDEESHP